MPRRRFDVVLLSDFRFPGGTSSSLATEIRVQAAAGYRTALLHVPAPVLSTARPFNAKIRACLDEGLAELVLADDAVDADLLVVRHPDVLSSPPAVPPDVRAEQRVMVVNQVPDDASQLEPFYSVRAVDDVSRACFGGEFLWAPIGPLVRQALLADEHRVRLAEHDWHNVLRTDESRAPRTGFVSDRPVIGRHSRGHWRKWPETPEAVLAAYPDDERYAVRVLGGAEVPRAVLGRIPSNWEVLGFDAVSVPEFLAGIDFFVYYHHSGLVEAFGRAVIEAVAAGAVAVLPPHFEPLFGDACRYADVDGARAVVDELYADPAAYLAQSARAARSVVERFGEGAHVRRLEALVGPRERSAASAARPARQDRVLVVLDPSGADAAGAQRWADTLSGLDGVAVVVVAGQDLVEGLVGTGAVVEGVPAVGRSDRGRWETASRRRLAHLVDVHRPDRVVLDGWPTNQRDLNDVFRSTPLVDLRDDAARPGARAASHRDLVAAVLGEPASAGGHS